MHLGSVRRFTVELAPKAKKQKYFPSLAEVLTRYLRLVLYQGSAGQTIDPIRISQPVPMPPAI